jgi:ubiquinone/menaquinone biosynthesis C-methylase UbiE
MDDYLRYSKFTYSEDDRRKRQNPESILTFMGLKEGMNFIDSGCHDGFFSLPAARIVGDRGKIYAIDIDKEALSRLQTKLQQENIKNTKIILSASEDVIIKENFADIIFFGTVLHDFYDPLKVLKNSRLMLKENGFIYDYDWRKQNATIGPPFEKRFNEEHVKRLALKANLEVISSHPLDDNYYAITLKRPSQV